MFDSIRRVRSAAVIVTLMYAFCSDQALAVPVLLSGIPDLSQHDDSSFANYCGPTAAANVVQYFRTLHGNNLLGVTPTDDAAANGLIGAPVGLSPPHGTPAAGSLAARMSTSLRDGTTPNNLRDGLDSYLEDTHDGVVGGSDWDTQLLLTQSAGGSLSGADFWSELQAAGNAGKGIILLIDWLPNPTPPPSTLPPESNDDQEYDPPESPGQGATVSIGHTVTMTGYELLGGSGLDTLYLNDSGNNKSSGHTWSPTYEFSTVNINPMNIDALFGLSGSQATGIIYGAVTTIPEPASAALLLAALPLILRRRR